MYRHEVDLRTGARFHEHDRVQGMAVSLVESLGGRIDAAAILGSGFSPLCALLDRAKRVPYADVEGLPDCTAPGHEGEIVAGSIGDRRLALFSGRPHLYEGLEAGEITVPVALARALGAAGILLTCAAGATSIELLPGSLVLIEDHINMTGRNPLLDQPLRERSPSFLSMVDAYDPAALSLAERLAADIPAGSRRSILASLPGPSFETPAEYRAVARLGAGVVSMSCALETIAARALGMRVLGVAIVANGPARAGQPGTAAEEVLAVVEEAVRSRLGFFSELLAEFARL